MSERRTIELPDIGDSGQVAVSEILVKPGDRIEADDPLLTLESDKAAMEVPAPFAGVVSEILVDIGTSITQGTPIFVVEAADAPVPAAPKPVPPAEPEPAPVAAGNAAAAEGAPAHGASASGIRTSPSVRVYARKLGVDLAAVTPSGPKDRILMEDVQNHVRDALSQPTGTVGLGTSLPPWPKVDHAHFGPVDRQPVPRIQQIAGASLARNWATIPHVTNFDQADVTALDAFRVHVNAEPHDPPVRLTMVAFLVKAAAAALKAFPRLNASFEGEALVLKNYVHIGFAVDTPRGLLVPVIRDCDRKGLLEIGAEIADLSTRARDGTLAPADCQGGCFSVSSLGAVRGTGFTPIINAPEIAILGASRAAMGPVWDGTAFVPRLLLPLSLSWDHRAVDGVAAARFLAAIAEILGDFRRAQL